MSRAKVIGVVVLVTAIGAAATVMLWPSGAQDYTGATYTASTMDLRITVLEGGNLESSNSLEIKSRVEGQTTILSIVPDGTMVTEEDVKNAKLLVELDSANLEEKAEQQEITFQSASAAFTQAREALEIQTKQNESDIQAGELDVKFAKMDFEKYLGAGLARQVLEVEVKLEAFSVAEMSTEDAQAHLKKLDLGGEGLKTLRQLVTDIDQAAEEVTRATTEYDWSKKLGPKSKDNPEGKGYISGTVLETDRLALKTRRTNLEQARLGLDIFLRYDLPKEVEQRHSNTVEAGRELLRIRAKARSELAQKEAEMKSKEAAFRLQKSRLEKFKEQIGYCTIHATRAGMVVYSSTSNRWGRSQDTIEEGTTVRHKQAIFSIPDPSSMSVKVRVHEASVNKVKVGQKVRITVDAYPDRSLMGTVRKVSVLPEPQHRFLSPNLKVYGTKISIDDPPDDLKTGMSVRAEILVSKLEGVTVVPIQAVSTSRGRRVCYVLNDGQPEARTVQTGQLNEKYIEITEGLAAGEEVLLRVPDVAVETGPEEAAEPDASSPEKAGTAAPEQKEPAASSGDDEAPKADADAGAAEAGDGEAEISKWMETLTPERRERMKKMLDSLTPEERKRMLDRMRRGGGRRGGGRREGSGREGGRRGGGGREGGGGGRRGGP